MNNKKSLLHEICRLIDDYPPEEWASLYKVLSAESVMEVMAKIAPNVNLRKKAALQKPKPDGNKRKEVIPKFLDLEITDNEKRQLLLRIRNALRIKEISPTLADLRDLAEVAGIKDQLPAKRNPAVDKIVHCLVNKEIPEIHHILENAAKGRADLGEQYFRWVDYILNRKKEE